MEEELKPQGKSTKPAKRSPGYQERIAIALESLERRHISADNAGQQQNGDAHNAEIAKWTRRAASASISYTFLTALLLAASIYSVIEAWRAVGAANRAADSATKQAVTADDTEKRQLRAYVSVIASNVSQFEVGKPILFSYTLKNFGQTPALNVTSLGVSQIVPISATGVFPIADYRGVPKVDFLTLAPGREYPAGTVDNPSKRKMAQSDKDLIDAGTHVAILYGTIYYDDIFGLGRKSDYCFYFRKNDIPTRQYAQCGNHWGVDEEAEGDISK